ncbi:MAG TPA: histidinol dehydrogenase [Terriglobales bacterium]|nr:histidinol dehydrogenase [Terriglobales bacterium]
MQVLTSGTVKGSSLISEMENRGSMCRPSLDTAVRKIIQQVRTHGDSALFHYAMKWDGFKPGQRLLVSEAEMQSAWDLVSLSAPGFCKALRTAAVNIRKYCAWQKPKAWERELRPGVRVGQVIRPLESVGCYVPGGLYPLPSTLLMTVIPAQVAGVPNIAVASPKPALEVLAAASMLGVKTFYRLGGAQAIAAFAYGTETVSRVRKIVGPGNAYVTAAKRLVFRNGTCSIDMVAGPTEILIVSERGNPAFIAADLVAQAEHDSDARSIFLTSSAALAKNVLAEVRRQAKKNAIAELSLRKNGLIIIARSHRQAVDIANRIAAEHITIEREDVARISAAGSIFVGDYSAQSLGDYASGPNHVLPTDGSAHFRGGLSVSDFVKSISIQEVSLQGLRSLVPAVTLLAEAEGLRAHAASVRMRAETRAANA